ncbi:hypothetical protein N7532_000033 [Penicillium argentinense]|uniref:Xylanolytic transcriptional activator regulatory domain-containing protein n=1 Tax=Penicillium argentinense TaxID=1131581 RepID=A0A9W9KNG8_9EURO|nr:uncharacterized protein N7532_000033 [Penicillium argentinense]KAJ5111988.1 hypothetical protein N7532_000033 [Penicillium argentinense]
MLPAVSTAEAQMLQMRRVFKSAVWYIFGIFNDPSFKAKAPTECLFDAAPDGMLRSQGYVATLEARIQNLERQLKANKNGSSRQKDQASLTPETTFSHSPANMRHMSPRILFNTQIDTMHESTRHTESKSLCDAQFPKRGSFHDRSVQNEQSSSVRSGYSAEKKSPRQDISILGVINNGALDSRLNKDTLPDLPSDDRARELVDTVYFYTQARYCIIDWAQLREWHRDREMIAYTSPEGPAEQQTGTFFIWIIYAIGACLVPNPESSTEEYFSRAQLYIPAVMSFQSLETVQALLCLTQYYFRAPNESLIWDLVGVALRLCIKLRYHRKTANTSTMQNKTAYQLELQKRFFWCAYCFDRLISMMSKLPFGISDSEIDTEVPVDIDDTCTDEQAIRILQIKQAAGDYTSTNGTTTTMTAALHHLQVYRIRSRILTHYAGPHARMPSLNEVQDILFELDQWRQNAPRKQESKSFPQQNPDRVQANYLQAVLLLIRPILTGDLMNLDLIGLCVMFAADACESAKALSLNPLTLPDRITVYHCFYAGITLLQCLVIKPTALTPRQAHRAISACLSALAVYTRVLPGVEPFLRLFEDVSNLFVHDGHTSETHQTPKVRDLLNKIISSDPSETSSILQSLSHHEGQPITSPTTPGILEGQTMAVQYDSVLGGQASVAPFEMPLDISPLHVPDAQIMDMWTSSWLDSASASQ